MWRSLETVLDILFQLQAYQFLTQYLKNIHFAKIAYLWAAMWNGISSKLYSVHVDQRIAFWEVDRTSNKNKKHRKNKHTHTRVCSSQYIHN